MSRVRSPSRSSGYGATATTAGYRRPEPDGDGGDDDCSGTLAVEGERKRRCDPRHAAHPGNEHTDHRCRRVGHGHVRQGRRVAGGGGRDALAAPRRCRLRAAGRGHTCLDARHRHSVRPQGGHARHRRWGAGGQIWPGDRPRRPRYRGRRARPHPQRRGRARPRRPARSLSLTRRAAAPEAARPSWKKAGSPPRTPIGQADPAMMCGAFWRIRRERSGLAPTGRD